MATLHDQVESSKTRLNRLPEDRQKYLKRWAESLIESTRIKEQRTGGQVEDCAGS